jgi:hypothetical protein
MQPLLLSRSFENAAGMSKRFRIPLALMAITATYFLLGFVSILSASLALLCMALPFMLTLKDNRRSWCSSYCPRAATLTAVGRVNKHWKTLPSMFLNGKLRTYLLWYFGLNLLFIAGSTVRVGMQEMAAMDHVRLFIAIALPGPLPQLIPLTQGIPPWVVHLSYRFYSMMLSSTIMGIAAALIWRPRAWCAVCPVGNLTRKMVDR